MAQKVRLSSTPGFLCCSQSRQGYAQLIRAYVGFILAKLRFHRHRPEFNGLFEYEEYISLKGIDDPNEGCVPAFCVAIPPRRIFTSIRSYETISDLMNLQDQIESFQKLIFAHFRQSMNNECRISSLVPLVKESYNIYRFITSMLRAMHRRTGDVDALEPLRARYDSQHHNLRKFYFECSNLKYLTGLINVPKLGADPPNLLDNGQAPELPKRPTTAAAAKAPTPPPAAPSPDANMIREQAAMLKEYEDKQLALEAQKKAEEERRRQQELQQQMEMEEKQRQQAERERLAQEQLRMQQVMQFNDQNAQVVNQLQMEMLTMRGQYERDQIMLEQYDRVRPYLSF